MNITIEQVRLESTKKFIREHVTVYGGDLKAKGSEKAEAYKLPGRGGYGRGDDIRRFFLDYAPLETKFCIGTRKPGKGWDKNFTDRYSHVGKPLKLEGNIRAMAYCNSSAGIVSFVKWLMDSELGELREVHLYLPNRTMRRKFKAFFGYHFEPMIIPDMQRTLRIFQGCQEYFGDKYDKDNERGIRHYYNISDDALLDPHYGFMVRDPMNYVTIDGRLVPMHLKERIA